MQAGGNTRMTECRSPYRCWWGERMQSHPGEEGLSLVNFSIKFYTYVLLIPHGHKNHQDAHHNTILEWDVNGNLASNTEEGVNAI